MSYNLAPVIFTLPKLECSINYHIAKGDDDYDDDDRWLAIMVSVWD